MKRVSAAIAATLLIGSAWALPAQAQNAERAIDARNALMTLFGYNLGPLGAMAKGDIEYDAEAAQAYANNLAAAASMDQRSMWPAGSDNVAMEGKTRALPKMWETYPAVLDDNNALVEATAALAEVAGNGQEALGAAMGGVGKACGTCHENYRGPRI